MCEVIAEVTGAGPGRIGVVSGPKLAREIAHREPAASVVACIDEAFRALRAMFRRHLGARRYRALDTGDPAHDTFTVAAPLGRRAHFSLLLSGTTG